MVRELIYPALSGDMMPVAGATVSPGPGPRPGGTENIQFLLRTWQLRVSGQLAALSESESG